MVVAFGYELEMYIIFKLIYAINVYILYANQLLTTY